MTPDHAIYDLINYNVGNTYFNKFAQSVKLDEATPKVLITNISHQTSNTKDKIGREEYYYRIEVIGTNYMNVSNVSEQIKTLMINFTDDSVYLVDYESGVYDTDDTAEIHRMIKDYRVWVATPVTS